MDEGIQKRARIFVAIIGISFIVLGLIAAINEDISKTIHKIGSYQCYYWHINDTNKLNECLRYNSKTHGEAVLIATGLLLLLVAIKIK